MATTVLDVRAQVHACLRLLAERCDGAVSKDDEGFTKIDADFGRELAKTSHLSPAQVIVATHLLRRYQRHLEALGMVVPDKAAVTSWAAEQNDIVSDEERAALIADLTPLLEPAVPPTHSAEDGSQVSDLSKDTPAWRVYVQDGRLFVEFPYDRSRVNAMQPLKECVDDWAFNRYKRQEWSFPTKAAAVVFEALRSFHDFTYSADAIGLVMRAHREEALDRQVRELEERWQALEELAALEAVQPYLDGAPTANGQRLFRHQREAVQRMIEAGRFILAHDLGLGKTKSSLIAAQAYDLPIWVIAPAGTIINWQREAKAAGVEITLYSWAKLPEPPSDIDYVLIADECFPYDTQIVTDQGLFPIGEIVEKALPLSVLSYNCEKKHIEWKPITRYIHRTLQGHLIRVVHEHGSFICTPNHKIWTEEHGYIEAGTLESGACLRILPEHIPHPQKREEHCQVLQQVLCEPITHQTIGTHVRTMSGHIPHPIQREEYCQILQQVLCHPTSHQISRISRDDSFTNEQTATHQNLCMVSEGIIFSSQWREKQQTPILQQQMCQLSQSEPARESGAIAPVSQACSGETSWRQAPGCSTKDEDQQPYDGLGYPTEDATIIAGTYISGTWRQRRTYHTSTYALTSIEITYRIPDTDSRSQGAISLPAHLLQGRYRQPRAQACDRSGWQDAQTETLEVPGSAQNRNLASSRVVGVEIYQSESTDGTGPGSGRNQAVYNLEVLDNHNYIADGVLVSNCHYAQSGEGSLRGQGFLNLAAQARAVFMLTGTPIKNSLPINLWPLLVAAKHPLAVDRSAYEKRYCGAYFKSLGRKKTVYDVSGASNLDELHERTRDVILYKKKSECIDLPEKLSFVE